MSHGQELTTQQRLGFIFETETAVMLIEEGLIALTREIRQPHRLNLPFLLLAQGIERLLKLVLLIGRFQATSELLDSNVLKRTYGHHLLELVKAVEGLMRSAGYADESAALRCDLQFLRNSKDLRVLLNVLETFALQGRYHDLEIAAGGESHADLQGLVGTIQSQFLKKRPEVAREIEAGKDRSLTSFHAALLADLTESIQRFARALCRTYTLGLLGNYGKTASAPLGRFLYLRDDELGSLP